MNGGELEFLAKIGLLLHVVLGGVIIIRGGLSSERGCRCDTFLSQVGLVHGFNLLY